MTHAARNYNDSWLEMQMCFTQAVTTSKCLTKCTQTLCRSFVGNTDDELIMHDNLSALECCAKQGQREDEIVLHNIIILCFICTQDHAINANCGATLLKNHIHHLSNLAQ